MRAREWIEQWGGAIGSCRSQRVVDLDRRYVGGYGVGYTMDQVLIDGQADDGGEKAFGHAVGHVDTGRIAPFGDDIAFVDDQSRRVAALFQRSYRFIEGFVFSECLRL